MRAVPGGGLFGELDEEARRAAWMRMRRRKFKKGEVIFHEGDPGDALHLIVKGHVTLKVSSPRGDRVMLRVLGPDEMLGEFAIVAPAARAATVTALDAVETMVLDREGFDQLRKEQPRVDEFMLSAAIEEVRRLSASLLEALYLPVDARVCRRLCELGELFRNGDRVVVPIGQDDLAQLAGVTRQTVNRVLQKAQADDVLRVDRGRLEILDLDGLSRRAR
jgi:CRP-like cAMP-binding protein